MSEHGREFRGNILLSKDTGANRVIDVVVDVGNLIREPHNGALIGPRGTVCPVIPYAVANFQGQIEPFSALLQKFDGSHTLDAMLKAAGAEPVQNTLSGMPEGGVAQIVSQRDCLRECLV